MSVEFKDWDVDHWAYLNGKPEVEADFKREPKDFIVDEKLGFELTGEGENLFLHIEKTGLNTQQVCQHLAKVLNKRLRDIGYAGLKDKQAITRQWFSVQVNVKSEPDLSAIETEQIKLLSATRHNKKLRVGALAGNGFIIRLRNVSDQQALIARLQTATAGVPNYFGPQRFGIKGNNLNWANRMSSGEQIRDKKLKGFALSAARSYLFNQVVSERIAKDHFEQPLEGDVYSLSGSNSYFSETISDAILARLQSHDISISAPLWGDGELATEGEARALELTALTPFQTWQNLLQENALEQERRSIHLMAEDLKWQTDNEDLIVSFILPTGCFATSVLRECVRFRESSE